MKLFQQTKGFDDPERGLHALERQGWVKGGYKRLMTIEVRTFCGIVMLLEKGEALIDYEKAKHRKSICKKCVKTVLDRAKRK